MNLHQAYIVTDLGFGDSGKGTTVDSLTGLIHPSLFIRSNGGCQAAHTVVKDDQTKHTFHIFGAGSLSSDAPTYCAPAVVLHPLVMYQEAMELGGVHTLKRLIISPQCRITTSYQRLTNQCREIARGNKRHGSCGIGFGETVEDSLLNDLALTVADVLDPKVFKEKLTEHRKLKLEVVNDLWSSTSHLKIEELYREMCEEKEFEAQLELYPDILGQCCIGEPDLRSFAGKGPLICEGAQGVLIDEQHGMAPYHTWSDCTSKSATKVLESQLISDYQKIGVIRALPSRHGAGPFPTEDLGLTYGCPDPHNPTNAWQQNIRVGYPDLVMLGYAVRVNGGIDGLAVTYMDALDQHYPENVAVRSLGACLCEHCIFETECPGVIKSPRTTIDRIDFLPELSEHAGAPVIMTGWGPRSDEKMWVESALY